MWRCRDLGVYGEGALTATHPGIHTRGVDYTVEHAFTIPKLTFLIISLYLRTLLGVLKSQRMFSDF